MNIGIIGYGFLGKAFEYAFAPKSNIFINDVAYEINNIKFFSKYVLVEKCDIIFLGLPTPYSLTSGFDDSIINDVLNDLNEIAMELNKKQLVCIKSAILPSYVTTYINKYTNLDITVSPEYLSGRNAIQDMVTCNILIVGGDNDSCYKVIDIFIKHSVIRKDLKIGKCSAVDAALIKYMENSFMAMKCVFLSEFYKLHDKVKTDDSVIFNELIRQFQFDERVGVFEYKIPYMDGELGYCSHCLCKDAKSIYDESVEHGVPLNLIREMSVINEDMRKEMTNPHKRCLETWGGVVE